MWPWSLRLHVERALYSIDEDHVEENAEAWTAAVTEVAKGYDTGVFAFIDGKLFFTTSLMWCKKAIYSGKHHRPGLRFQTVVAPNGLLIHVYGPVAGRPHDANMLKQSGLMRPLARLYRWGLANNPVNSDPIPSRGLNIYGDAAYPQREGMFSAYKTTQLNAVPARIPIQDGLNEGRTEMEHFTAI